MKKLFIYYSLSGNGDVVANYLHDRGVTVRKVTPNRELPYNMVLRILAGGFLAGIGYKDTLVNFDSDIREYEHIVIGSPIWNGRLSTPVNALLDRIDLTAKKTTFVLYSGSGVAPKTIKMLQTRYPKSNTIILKEPKKASKDELYKLDKI